MSRKKITCIILYLSIVLSASAQNKADMIQVVLDRLSSMLNTADTALIRNDLNPNFSVSIATWPASASYLNRIAKQNNVESILLLSIHEEGVDTTFINARFDLKDGKTVESIIALDSENKLLFVDYFDCFYSRSRYTESEQLIQIPFEIQDGSIVLTLRVNENSRPLKFLFDSGANGIAVSETMADSLQLFVGHKKTTTVVGGRQEISISPDNTIHLTDNFSLQKQNIAVFKQGGGLDGIIGLNLAFNHIVNVDFDTQLITLFTFGKYSFPVEGELLDIRTPAGIIFIPAVLNIVGKKELAGQFVFDTGADYHFIAFEQFVRKNRLLLSGFKPEKQSRTVSMGIATPTYEGKAYTFRIGTDFTMEQMPISLQASRGIDTGESRIGDGSIGIALLSKFNFTIDLLQKKVHLKPNKKYNN